MTDAATVREIAEGISPASAAALRRLCEGYAWADRRSVKALQNRGLAKSMPAYMFSDTEQDWVSAPSPLGREINTHLLAQEPTP